MENMWNASDEPSSSELLYPTEDAAETGEVAETDPDQPSDVSESKKLPPIPGPPRPRLQRNTLQGAPPMPAPDPPRNVNDSIPADVAPTDSLSLMQLRRLVAEVHKAEPIAYDFEYTDWGPHADEVDEWFTYQFWQWVRLNAAQRAFEWLWEQETEGDKSWDDADNDTRTRFVRSAIAGMQSNDAALRSASIGKLMYLVLGRWGDTAMQNATDEKSHSVASLSQLQAINAGVECLSSLDGLPVVWEALRNSFEMHWSNEALQSNTQESQDELMNLMTIMYISIQETLNDRQDMASTNSKLLDLRPSLVEFMMTATHKLRWDEHGIMPQTQIFLLFWKSILLVFGGAKELKEIKQATNDMATDILDKKTITASPLDYYAFRQEIIAKYPAYVPPRPPLPLEADNPSLLPPLHYNPLRNSAANGIIPAPPNAQSGGASILHQPVHIATPVPSPPPSPGVGGKGGKKQNYQTNQSFPFMYPPLDATSNSAGGKGMLGIDHEVVNRRWEGSDVPASILEAGELFSSRVRMTRATRQLWMEREKFLKYERGWDDNSDYDEDDDDIPGLDLSELTEEEREILREVKSEDRKGRQKKMPPPETEPDFGPRPERVNDEHKHRLTAVESFYHGALPDLQSLVIVLLRPIFNNLTAVVAQQPLSQAPQGMGRGNPTLNGGMGNSRSQDGLIQAPPANPADMSPEEVDAARTREITAKAMTGILLLLLKWFRVSHVLKYEYLTQLLLDSNYVPLVLKLFAHQDVHHVVNSKLDRVENSFFQFCNLRSKLRDEPAEGGEEEEKEEGEEDEREVQEGAQKQEDNTQRGEGEEKHKEQVEEQVQEEKDEEEEVEEEELVEVEEEIEDDDAAPPPIKIRRSPLQPSASQQEGDDGDKEGHGSPPRAEVDELGCPVTWLPDEPITDYSRRNLFSLINYLRIMQKICKNKAHRNLLLVQYKSSPILRKSLKIPQPELRLYTLKLFKNQVPFCGRKWRQGNMRVITAVYLHCRPGLRDEWLAGGDVDGEVEASLPQEQALRSLTYWSNLRRCPDQVPEGIRSAMREEQNFFSRELEKLNLNWDDVMAPDELELEHAEGWA